MEPLSQRHIANVASRLHTYMEGSEHDRMKKLCNIYAVLTKIIDRTTSRATSRGYKSGYAAGLRAGIKAAKG